jgi:hypothetical protein
MIDSNNTNFTSNGVNGISSDDYQGSTGREGGAVSISSSKKTTTNNTTHRSKSPFVRRQGRDTSSSIRSSSRNRDHQSVRQNNDVQLLPAIALPEGQTVTSRAQLDPSPQGQKLPLEPPEEVVHDSVSLTDETNTTAAVVIPEDVGTTVTITKVSSATSSSNHHYSPFPTLYNRKSQSRSISLGDEASLEDRSVLNDNAIDSRDDTTVEEDEMNKSRSVSFADTTYSSSNSGEEEEEEQSFRDDNDTIDFPTEQTVQQNQDDESDDDYGTSSFCSCGTIDQVEVVNLKVNTFSTRNVAHHERVVESVVSSENDDDDDTRCTDGSDSSSTCSGTIDGATLDGTIDDGTVDDGTVDDGTVGDGTLDDGTVLSYVSNQVDKERATNNGGLGWFSWLVCADGLENDVVTNNNSVPPTDDDDDDDDDDDATYDSTPNVFNNPASKMVDEDKTSMKQITPIKFDEQPSSVPLRRVPSLSKTLGLLKKSGSYDKSIASDGASTTTSKKKLKRMFKSKEKSPKGVKSPKDKSLNITNYVPPPKNEPTVDVYNKPSDSDNKLYRDLICMNHGGIENLVVRECSNIPRLNGTDHLLIKVEVREFIGSSREVYFLRSTM